VSIRYILADSHCSRAGLLISLSSRGIFREKMRAPNGTSNVSCFASKSGQGLLDSMVEGRPEGDIRRSTQHAPSCLGRAGPEQTITEALDSTIRELSETSN
jgi:hypothetical protein